MDIKHSCTLFSLIQTTQSWKPHKYIMHNDVFISILILSSSTPQLETDLIRAVQDNNVYNIKTLISRGVNINRTNHEGKTALFYAVQQWNNESVVGELIAAGADVNITDNEGKTALFYAVQQRYNERVVRALIAVGVDVNITDNEGKTALFYAMQQRYNERVVRALIAAGTDVNRTDNDGKTALFYAVQQSKNEKVVRALIAAGADVNRTDNEGKTALFYAVQESDNESVGHALIAAGADVNITDNEGKTALFYGVQQSNNKIVVGALIAAGADVNRTDNEGKTALFYAVQQSYNKSVVHVLINACADVNITDNKGKTALFYAVQQSKNEKVVRALIAADADVNRTDNEGETALFYAVQLLNKTVIYELVDGGADVNTTDNEGKTALFYAVQQSKNEKVVLAFIAADADVNRTDNERKTALFYAVQNDNEKVVRALIAAGTDVNRTDNDGKTALFYAIQNDNESVVSAFIDAGVNMTFIIETFYLPKIKELLKSSTSCKAVDRKTLLKLTLSIAFCKLLCFKPGSSDINVNSLSAALGLVNKFTSKFEIKKRNIIKKVFRMINEYPDIQLIQSRNACTKLIRQLIKLGANPNTVDSHGNTALHYATQLALHGVSQDKVMEICHQLEEFNVSFDIKNHRNETPLLFCLSRTVEKMSRYCCPLSEVKAQVAVCKFLIGHGSNIEEKTQSGKSVLHLVLELLQQALLEQDGELRKEILGEIIRLIKEVFMACNPLSAISKDNSGNTPLHLWATLHLTPGLGYFTVIAKGREFHEILYEILAPFTKLEAQLNVKNKNGETPLHLCRTWAAVELLLDAGAIPNDVDASGRSPLLVAANNESLKRLGSLYPDISQHPKEFWRNALRRGLNPWTVDEYGESVLSLLIKSESCNYATALVRVACDQDSDVRTHLSIMFSLLTSICKDTLSNAHWKKDIAEMILSSKKCPVNGKENEDSPLHYCCKNIIEALKGGSSVEIKTTVHWSMVKLLRSYGADYRIADASGLTCLDIAERCPALKELLLEPL